jgi:hypothetical protein
MLKSQKIKKSGREQSDASADVERRREALKKGFEERARGRR